MSAGSVPAGVLLTVAYDGARYGGYARQSNARTIAGELWGAITAIDAKASDLRGASRTDAGVHARGQLVAFDAQRVIKPRSWALGLAGHLPAEICVVRAARVPAGYDPRRHALRKVYRYVLLRSQVRDPFWSERCWRVGYRLNHQLMQQEAALLLGRHDFAAFRSSSDDRDNTVRTIFRADVSEDACDPRVLNIVIEGDRFLHRMVRIIAGTLVDVGRGRLRPGAVTRGLSSRSRLDLGMTAPAGGLCLERVHVDDAGTDAWPPDDLGGD